MLKSAALVAALALASARSAQAHSVFACLVPNYPNPGQVSAYMGTYHGVSALAGGVIFANDPPPCPLPYSPYPSNANKCPAAVEHLFTTNVGNFAALQVDAPGANCREIAGSISSGYTTTQSNMGYQKTVIDVGCSDAAGATCDCSTVGATGSTCESNCRAGVYYNLMSTVYNAIESPWGNEWSRIECVAGDPTNPGGGNTCELSVSCPADATLSADDSCSAAAPSIGTVSSSNCDGVASSQNVAVGSALGLGAHAITVHAHNGDDSAEAECTTTYTVVDDSAPGINKPANKVIECTDSTEPSNTGAATCTDNCGATASYSDVVSPGACPQESSIARTWTCTDAAGNSVSAVQIITIVDSTAPVGTGGSSCLTNNNRFHCFEDATSLVSFTDNCGDVSVAFSGCSISAPPPSSSSGSSSSGSSRRLRALKGKKSASNSGSSSSSGRVCKAQGADIFLGTAADAQYFNDADGNVACIYYGGAANKVCVRGKATGAEKATGRDITITFTGTDECGNSAQASHVVNVVQNKKAGCDAGCDVGQHKLKMPSSSSGSSSSGSSSSSK